MALEIPQRIGIVRIGCKFAKAQEVSVTRSAFNLKAGEADAIGHLPYGANPGLEKFLAVLLIYLYNTAQRCYIVRRQIAHLHPEEGVGEHDGGKFIVYGILGRSQRIIAVLIRVQSAILLVIDVA